LTTVTGTVTELPRPVMIRIFDRHLTATFVQ
jgi:hypothetical protein